MKDALGILDTDTSQDEIIALQITQMSDVISDRMQSRLCKRESCRRPGAILTSRRVYLSHWPAKAADITSVECPRGSTPYVNGVDWELEEKTGKLSLFTGQSEPISVTYTGGYNLPDEAPPALQAACEILVRSYRIWNIRQATSGIRSISHKDARVMFFDPNVLIKAIGSTPLATAGQTVKDLLYHYMRIWV